MGYVLHPYVKVRRSGHAAWELGPTWGGITHHRMFRVGR